MCVVVEYGAGKAGYLDGSFEDARFNGPSGVCLSKSGDVLLCADTDNHRIRCIDLVRGVITTWAGSGERGVLSGALRTAAFNSAYSVCVDPSRAGCYFIADWSSIRYCDGETVSIIVGGAAQGDVDGVGDDARIGYANDVLCTSDGSTLYVTDSSYHKLRSIDLKSRRMKTIAGSGDARTRDGAGVNSAINCPYQMCFDRSRSAQVTSITTGASTHTQPESSIFIASIGGILRYNTQYGKTLLSTRWPNPASCRLMSSCSQYRIVFDR